MALSVETRVRLPVALDFAALAGFCALLFVISVRNVRRKRIV